MNKSEIWEKETVGLIWRTICWGEESSLGKITRITDIARKAFCFLVHLGVETASSHLRGRHHDLTLGI